VSGGTPHTLEESKGGDWYKIGDLEVFQTTMWTNYNASIQNRKTIRSFLNPKRYKFLSGSVQRDLENYK
jgi:hypothetical protein